MNLPPEARRQGEENFHGAIASDELRFRDSRGNSVSRRDFLKGSIVGGLVSGGGLGAYYFGYGASVGNPVRIGIIGTGDEGGVLIGALNPKYVNVVGSDGQIKKQTVTVGIGDESYTEVKTGLTEGTTVSTSASTAIESSKRSGNPMMPPRPGGASGSGGPGGS